MRTSLALLLLALPAARADDALDGAAALYRAGRPFEALAALDAAPPPVPLTRWAVPFGGVTVPTANVGRKHVVLTTHASRGAEPYPLAGPAAGPTLNDRTSVYDFDVLYTGFDAVTGKRLWTRRAPGHNDVTIDDRTDAVYVWRERLFKLNPTTGATEAETPLPKRPFRFDALLIDGRLHRPRPNTSRLEGPTEKLPAYDVDRGRAAEFDPVAARLSPDERRVLAVTTGGFGTWITARPLRAAEPDWKFVHPSPSCNEPFWLDGDVVALVGEPFARAEVIRLDGGTGAVKWRHALPRGAYRPAGDQLRGGAYPERSWSAVGMCGGYILAVGGEGSLYFLDPDTGRRAAKATPARKYLNFPRLVDGALVVCGFDGILAIPWNVVLRRSPDEGDRVVLRARCLHALGRNEAAITAVDDLLKLDPERAEAWAVKADASRAADRPSEEVAARCRHLELTGRDSSPELRERIGLLKRIATGHDLTSDLGTSGDAVYAVTVSGAALAIDVHTLRAERTELPASSSGLSATTVVKAHMFDSRTQELTPADAGPKGAPAAWNTSTGYDGRPVRWQGKWYRPLDRGGVRVLDGDAVKEFPPRVQGLRSWKLHVSPWGPPVGHGAGGVYELDENLVPVRALIPAPLDMNAWRVAGDARTLAVLTHRNAGPHVQVWTRDGSKMLREQLLLSANTVGGGDLHLIPLAGGYLYAGSSLAWVPAGDGPAWRFGFGDTPAAVPKLYYAHACLFGRPVVRDGLLFAGCRDGAVYVFDLATVTGR
ncbi:MAG TPA: PQQ-binding-like beta-propeller repeat protein [Urbifossiella sp.]|nr:PQQ-binding-like beta-propeller repeat protein [Urbifossiella sp.]